MSIQTTTRYECDFCYVVEEVDGDDSTQADSLWVRLLWRHQSGPYESWCDITTPQPTLCSLCAQDVAKAIKACKQINDED